MVLLAKQANEFQPSFLVVQPMMHVKALMALLVYSPTIFVGDSGLLELVDVGMDILLVVIVGTACLSPVVTAIPKVKHIAIAKKRGVGMRQVQLLWI